MNQYEEYLREASRTFKVADHMISVTYPLVKDNKLLLAILENICLSLTNSISALVYFDRYYKRVPPFQDKFESVFNMFRMKCVSNYGIDKSHVEMVQDIRSLIKEHKESPVEFSRDDKFVICSGNYNLNSVSIEDMRKYLQKTKEFIGTVENIIAKHERSNA
jgi:hypothetical protein